MGWGCLYELESLEMEQRYECWSVKGTTAASPLLAITHKHHLAASHQKEKTSHLHHSAKHVKTVWNCLRPKYLGCIWVLLMQRRFEKRTYWSSVLQIFLFCTYATNKFRSLTCCFDCLKPLILPRYNVQLKGFPDPLHNSTSDPTNPTIFPHPFFPPFSTFSSSVWPFFAVQPSMKTHWKTTSRKLVNCVKSKQRVSEKIGRWEGWFSFLGSKVRLSIDTSSDSWYFRCMLDRCRELRSAPHVPADWFWSFSDFISVKTYFRSQKKWCSK